ncbi:Alpha/Beta hydrolase protein [Trichoderma velutinum]
MSTQQTAKTQYVEAPNGVKYAYRRIGATTGTPLLFLGHFRSTMDHWDPLLINTISARRNVILYDYLGVGRSTGQVASTFRQAAADVHTFLGLIGVTEVDILGFSIGGMAAQLIGLNAPSSINVRKLVLCGTGPSAGSESVPTPNQAGVLEYSLAKHMELPEMRKLFFPMTKEGEYAAHAYWERIHERGVESSGEEHVKFLSDGLTDGGDGMNRMRNAIDEFFTPETSQGLNGSYERLADLKMPVLVANGHDDFMVPTVNSLVIQQKVPNGTLIVYPRSGHGFLFQFSSQFGRDVLNFLES